MKDGSDDRLRIHVQVCENVRNRHRMSDIGLTAQSLLALMGLSAELVRIANAVHLRRWQVGFEFIEKLRYAYRASSGRQQTQNGRRVIHDGGKVFRTDQSPKPR